MELDPVYGSDLPDVISRFGPDAWLFGHTHRRFEAQEGATLIRNVSLGYPDEVAASDEADVLARGFIELKNEEYS